MYMLRNSRVLTTYPMLVVGVLLMGYSLTSTAEEIPEARISEKILARVYYTNVSFSSALAKLSMEHKLPICTEIPFSVTPPLGV